MWQGLRTVKDWNDLDSVCLSMAILGCSQQCGLLPSEEKVMDPKLLHRGPGVTTDQSALLN